MRMGIEQRQQLIRKYKQTIAEDDEAIERFRAAGTLSPELEAAHQEDVRALQAKIRAHEQSIASQRERNRRRNGQPVAGPERQTVESAESEIRRRDREQARLRRERTRANRKALGYKQAIDSYLQIRDTNPNFYDHLIRTTQTKLANLVSQWGDDIARPEGG